MLQFAKDHALTLAEAAAAQRAVDQGHDVKDAVTAVKAGRVGGAAEWTDDQVARWREREVAALGRVPANEADRAAAAKVADAAAEAQRLVEDAKAEAAKLVEDAKAEVAALVESALAAATNPPSIEPPPSAPADGGKSANPKGTQS